MPIRQLGYLHWMTPAFEEWRTFAVDVMGFMPVDGPDPESMYFRWDDRPFRLVITEADEKQIAAAGLEVRDDVELAEVVATLVANGFEVEQCNDKKAAARCVSGLVRFNDPGGLPVELFYGPILDHVPVVTPLVNGFVTGDMGMGHIVVGSTDLPGADRLYRSLLGFKRRNTARFAEPGLTEMISMNFYGCNPRHHTLGIIGLEIPGTLIHFMVEATSIDDVGRALDRCADHGVPIQWSLGKHTNDHMVSFYCISPDGTEVEFGCQGMRIEGALDETTYEITKPSFWGHRPPAL